MSELAPDQPLNTSQDKVSSFTILGNIFTSPSQAMAQAQRDYGIVFPMLAVMLMSGIAMAIYFYVLDYSWYIDHLVEITAGELSKSEQKQQRDVLSMMSKPVMGSITVVSAMIGSLVVYVIWTVYFVIVSKINNDGYEFKQWLSFTCWTGIPNLLAIVAMIALLLSSSNGQIAPESMNPLSLNELFFGLDPAKGLGKLLATLHLAQLWSLAVMVIGYHVWTKKSMRSSSLIVLTPFLLYFLGWYLIFV